MRILIFLVAVLFSFSLRGQTIEKLLDGIAPDDREKIEQLFSFFVRRDSLGYVLFGETKPVCATGIALTCKESMTPFAWTDNPLHYQKEIKGCWEVWQRYAHLFKHPNIIICEEYEGMAGGIYLHLFFINKKTVGPLLEKYREDFAEILGVKFSPKAFIAELEKKKKLRPLIQNDEKLMGLLLGFGRESSTAFKNFRKKGDELARPLGRIAHRPKGCPITPVCFRGYEDSQEVKELVKIYDKEIQEIADIFNDKNFLTITLQKLCS